MSETRKPETLAEVEESIIEYYCFACPECAEWHQHEISRAGKVIECMCGTTFKIARTRGR